MKVVSVSLAMKIVPNVFHLLLGMHLQQLYQLLGQRLLPLVVSLDQVDHDDARIIRYDIGQVALEGT